MNLPSAYKELHMKTQKDKITHCVLPCCTINMNIGVTEREAAVSSFHWRLWLGYLNLLFKTQSLQFTLFSCCRIQGRCPPAHPPLPLSLSEHPNAWAGHNFASPPHLLYLWPFSLYSDSLAVILCETSNKCIKNIPALFCIVLQINGESCRLTC